MFKIVRNCSNVSKYLLDTRIGNGRLCDLLDFALQKPFRKYYTYVY